MNDQSAPVVTANADRFTPGPWIFGANSRDVINLRGQLIAELGVREGDATHQADGELIAAAPDLLHALETLMAWIDSKPLPCTQAVLDAWATELHHRENRARVAIIKARGRGIGALLAESQQ